LDSQPRKRLRRRPGDERGENYRPFRPRPMTEFSFSPLMMPPWSMPCSDAPMSCYKSPHAKVSA
jgi:hypothetical protein